MNRLVETTTIETTMFSRMNEVSPQRVGTVVKQIEKAVASRLEYQKLPEQLVDGAVSKDISNLELFLEPKNIATYARFFVACGVAPEYYLNSVAYDAATFEAKSGISADAKTRNLKAYKKNAETALYFASGSRLESVLKKDVACMIIASQFMTVIPRGNCEQFLSSIPLSHVSDELREAIAEHQAKHMSGGAQTQTSQCVLTLCNMRAGKVVRNGRNKDFILDVHSPVIRSFAERFGMVPQLEKAIALRATVDGESAAA